jgi:hypothetical protein
MSTKLSFKGYIAEAISTSSADKASFLIGKYLKKKTGYTFFRYPGVEEFKNSKGKGFGLRFYTSRKNLSVRFNWVSATSVGLISLESIDFWNGKIDVPYHIAFDTSVSLIKTLPIIADIIKDGNPDLGSIYTLPDDVPLNESVSLSAIELNEAKGGSDVEEMVDGILDMIAMPNFAKGKVYGAYKSAGMKIFDQMEMMYPALIVKSGTKYSWSGTPKDLQKIRKEKDKILAAVGSVSGNISKGSASETYAPSGNIEEIENGRERLTFEKQLIDLERLLTLTVNGAANAIFVSGKGGVGKTHTTEKILAGLGLRDGDGYFKNTGSATAAGLYSLLFRYRNDIVFFDDSDDALGDQESRNLLKAATDTKKIRKLVWNKMGKNVVDPDDATDEEILDAGQIPRYFDFTGRIIFISNLKLDKLDPDGALRTRAFIIDIDPTDVEIYDFMDKIVGDIKLEDGLLLDLASRKHVVALLRKGKSKQSANLRKLSRGLAMAAGARAAGVDVGDDDLARMIESYA